jgi:transposase
MPQGVHFTPELREIFFRVIDFVEREKTGPQIPMNNTTARIVSMLGISESSLLNLKKEMKAVRELWEAKEKEEEEKRLRLRSSSQIRPTEISHKKQDVSTWSTSYDMNTIPPKTPSNIPGRAPVHLSEEADDEIRYHFHLLLAEKIYPTVAILLERLLTAHTDFPVRSQTTLRRHMHRLGFSYKRTNNVKVALDDNFFVAQRAFYFRKLDELRKAGALIMFHDETWVNIGEEKRSIWIDDRGQGRIRKTDGKGNKLRILLVTVFMHIST